MRHTIAQVLSKEFAHNVHGCTSKTCTRSKTGTPRGILRDNVKSIDAVCHPHDGGRPESTRNSIPRGEAGRSLLHRLHPNLKTAS